MGRGGVGGRASARRSWMTDEGTEVFSADGAKASMAFEHGCQFFAVPAEGPNTDAFTTMLQSMGARQWPACAERLGWVHDGKYFPCTAPEASNLGVGFLGACSSASKLFVAPGLCSKFLSAAAQQSSAKVSKSQLKVVTNTRITRLERTLSGRWHLYADDLHHEASAESLRDSQGEELSNEYDAVVLTDHMTFLPDWHPLHVRSLRNLAPRLVAQVRADLEWKESSRRFIGIVALFSCMLAYAPGNGPGDSVPFDAACVQGSAVLQWICRQSSKLDENGAECWIAVSTEAFAESCLTGTPMSYEREGEQVWYRPQTTEYLQGDPAVEMQKAFRAALEPLVADRPVASPLFVRCQRWGAAFPRVREASNQSGYINAADHDGEDVFGLFVAGDWVQPTPPYHALNAFESGAAVAQAMFSAMGTQQPISNK